MLSKERGIVFSVENGRGNRLAVEKLYETELLRIRGRTPCLPKEGEIRGDNYVNAFPRKVLQF